MTDEDKKFFIRGQEGTFYNRFNPNLRKALLDHPDLPMLFNVFCEYDRYGEWCSPGDVSYRIGEYLDYGARFVLKLYTDREEFEEDLFDYVERKFGDMAVEESKAMVQEILKECEPYWKKCIEVYIRV